MPPAGSFLRLVSAALLSAALSSCGVRMPGIPQPALSRTEVALSADTKTQPARDPDVLVWLISDELHTGMVFPYDWLIESGFIPPEGFGSPKYVTLSWGDRTAYVEKGLHSPGKILRALFIPTPSVMELIPANWDVAEVCPYQRIWRKLVARERGRNLATFLNDCSRMGVDGKPQIVGTSSWGGGVLLESRHVYFVPRICNVWTVHAIEALGGDLNAWTALTADGLVRQAETPRNGFEKIWPGGGPQVR
jgi:hypothetical protein